MRLLLLLVLCLYGIAGAQEAVPGADGPDLSTPRASLENFIMSARAGDYRQAAESLSMREVRNIDPAQDGPELAWKLKFVLDQELWIIWADVPDTPEGLFPEEREVGREARTDFELGRVPLGEREVPIQMRRRIVGGNHVWLISAAVVERIDALYDEHGLGPFATYIPPFLLLNGFLEVRLWQWLGFLVFGLAAWLLARGLRWMTLALWRRVTVADEEARNKITETMGTSIGTLYFLVLLYIFIVNFLALAEPVERGLSPVLFLLLAAVFTWLVVRLVHYVTELYGAPYEEKLEKYDAVRARQFRTRLVILRGVVNFVLVLAAAGIALSNFEVFRTVGTSLLASAGVAGIVLGLAAQRSLGNLFAGIQIALTQPVRIGDSVVFEGEWGWIEEISYTYVVIRIWDLRRLVVPITYLLDKPIQNWTLKSPELLGTVYLYADYRVPVEAVRAELRRILDDTPLWNGRVASVQVTDCKQEVVELRALCSASSGSNAWDLRCLVREKLVTFLQQLDEGRYLPRRRLEVAPEVNPATGQPEAESPQT